MDQNNCAEYSTAEAQHATVFICCFKFTWLMRQQQTSYCFALHSSPALVFARRLSTSAGRHWRHGQTEEMREYFQWDHPIVQASWHTVVESFLHTWIASASASNNGQHPQQNLSVDLHLYFLNGCTVPTAKSPLPSDPSFSTLKSAH